MTIVTPIIFNAPMVCAILDDRKSQTRRILKPQPVHRANDLGIDGRRAMFCDGGHPKNHECEEHAYGVPILCAPGDLLWVRETWAEHHPAGIQEGRYSIKGRAGIPGPPGVEYRVIYRADGDPLRVWHCEEYPYRTVKGPRDEIDAKHPEVCSEMPGWTPSIHMPRWASRITLEVTEVRVQRLQDISEEDVNAEGIAGVTKDGRLWKWGIPDRDGLPGNDDHGWHWQEWEADPRRAYAKLWNSLYGPDAWGRNPWVSAISFRTHRLNVDELLREREGAAG